MTKKRPTYVIDTNVFIGTGINPFRTYYDSDIVIPYDVVKSLEDKHHGDGKAVLRMLEQLRCDNLGISLYETAAKTSNGNTVRIYRLSKKASSNLPRSLNKSVDDTAVLATACCLRDEDSDRDITVISNSITTRLNANHYHLKAEPYTISGQPFTGHIDVYLGDRPHDNRLVMDEIGKLYRDKRLMPAHAVIVEHYSHGDAEYKMLDIVQDDPKTSPCPVICDIDHDVNAGKIVPRSHNIDQKVALNYLLNPYIQTVSLGGVAGAGKSFLALAAGMSQMEDGIYDRIIVFRSMVEVAQQKVGYLPGDLDDKMQPWAQAIWDNVAQIDEINGKNKKRNPKTGQPDTGKRVKKSQRATATEQHAPDVDAGVSSTMDLHANSISVQPVSYLRGRTFVRSFIIVDDAQSLERLPLLDIISRLGEGSKIVFTYDMSQQDNNYVSAGNSILSVVDDMLARPDFAHIDFTKSERSSLAQFAADLLANES